MKVIKVLGYALNIPCPWRGMYLVDCDFEADMTKVGAVMGTFTGRIKNAKQFNNLAEAIAFYRTIRRRDGLRADGKPDRPLTAFTVEFVEVP